MSLQPYALRKPWAPDEDAGVVIIDNVTGLALPISHNALLSVDDALEFLEWVTARCRNWQLLEPAQAERVVAEWGLVRDLECPRCTSRAQLTVYRSQRHKCWICCCQCDTETAGNGDTAEEAIADWSAKLGGEAEIVQDAEVARSWAQ